MSCVYRELYCLPLIVLKHLICLQSSESHYTTTRQTPLLTFNIMVDHFLGVQEIKSLENMLRHPNNFKFSHGPTALQLLQNRPSLACFHEEMDSITP